MFLTYALFALPKGVWGLKNTNCVRLLGKLENVLFTDGWTEWAVTEDQVGPSSYFLLCANIENV